MKRTRDFALKMNRGGELLQENLFDYTKRKYKPDSVFLSGPVPFFLMAVCIIIDVAFFRSLFVRISYDDPKMIILEVAGLAFAADVVAAYAGVLAKRIWQGLSRDKFILVLLLGVPVVALVVNGILRVATMSLSSLDGVVDEATVALTIISIVTPVFTSVGNFAIGFQSYDPLAKKMYHEEATLEMIADTCRRLTAIKSACDDFSEETMLLIDQEHLANAKKAMINDSMMLLDLVRLEITGYMGDPASTSMLSQQDYEALFEKLNKALQALSKTVEEDKHSASPEVPEKTGNSFESPFSEVA